MRGGDGLGGVGALVGAVHDVEVGADEGERLVADNEPAAVDAYEGSVGDGAGERQQQREQHWRQFSSYGRAIDSRGPVTSSTSVARNRSPSSV